MVRYWYYSNTPMISLQTLHDLDILPSPKQKSSLFDKLNHCKTKGGEAVLKDFFLLEETTAETIQQRQDAIKHIVAKWNKLLPAIGENDIYYAEQYLNSSIGIIKAEKKLSRAIRTRYTTLFRAYQYHFVLSGVRQLLHIVRQLNIAYNNLYSSDTPVLLKQIFEEVRTRLQELNLTEKKLADIEDTNPPTGLLFNVDDNFRVVNRLSVNALLNLYYRLDAFIALAEAHKHWKLTFPALNASHLRLQSIYHPLVTNCVTNDIEMIEANLLIITGPNMAGKSTMMKSIGLAVFMAYMGIGVAAASAEIPWVDHITTSINIEDNITAGYSYFFSEVQNIKHTINMLHERKRLLVIADELFKGTNVRDAYDCSKMVLHHFLSHRNSFFIFSTHLAELATEFDRNTRCELRFVDATVERNGIHFDYKLKPGISKQRLGVNILQSQVPELQTV